MQNTKSVLSPPILISLLKNNITSFQQFWKLKINLLQRLEQCHFLCAGHTKTKSHSWTVKENVSLRVIYPCYQEMPVLAPYMVCHRTVRATGIWQQARKPTLGTIFQGIISKSRICLSTLLRSKDDSRLLRHEWRRLGFQHIPALPLHLLS